MRPAVRQASSLRARVLMPPRLTCAMSPATRTMKNSSRLLAEIDRNRSRSSSGCARSIASSSTRRLKSSQDSSRLMKRAGEASRSAPEAPGLLAVSSPCPATRARSSMNDPRCSFPPDERSPTRSFFRRSARVHHGGATILRQKIAFSSWRRLRYGRRNFRQAATGDRPPLKTTRVTGGAGFLGSHLCERLIAQGHDVLCVDNFFTGAQRNIAHLLGHPALRADAARRDAFRSMSRSTRSTISPARPRRSTTSSIRCRRPRPACTAPSTCWAWPSA